MKRLEAFHFHVSQWSWFDQNPKAEPGQEDSRQNTAEAAAKRSARYKAYIMECLKEEAGKARNVERVKQKAIEEVLQEDKALK